MSGKALGRIAILAVLLLPAALWGCSTRQDIQASPSFGASALADYDSLTEQYLTPLVGAQMLFSSWENAEDLEPDCFVYFYSALCASGLPDIPQPEGETVAAETLEGTVQRYFQTDTGHLRQSSFFDGESMHYRTAGIGGATNGRVAAAQWKDGKLILSVDLDQDLEPIHSGTLTLLFDADGGFKYTSFIVSRPAQP